MSFYIMTTRGWQMIPCIAVNHNDVQGLFSPPSLEEAAAETDMRAESFRRDVQAYINSELSKEEVFRAYKIPMYGSYGEKL